MTPDLDNVDNCPRAETCEGCGTSHPLIVTTATTPVGVHCVTVCRSCALQSSMPGSSAVAMVKRALDHCAHLRITADDMAAAMDYEGQFCRLDG